MTQVERMAELLQHATGLTFDEHGADTPMRFMYMLDELTKCQYDEALHMSECIKWKDFDNHEGVDEMVVQTNIPFVSVCNHHIIPFVGKAHIAYIPGDRIVGLSKLARVVQHYARRLQLQERMTDQIATYLREHLFPAGLAVMLQAEHLCMTIRGAQVPGTITTTSSMTGVFSDHSRTAKAEFLQIVGSSK